MYNSNIGLNLKNKVCTKLMRQGPFFKGLFLIISIFVLCFFAEQKAYSTVLEGKHIAIYSDVEAVAFNVEILPKREKTIFHKNLSVVYDTARLVLKHDLESYGIKIYSTAEWSREKLTPMDKVLFIKIFISTINHADDYNIYALSYEVTRYKDKYSTLGLSKSSHPLVFVSKQDLLFNTTFKENMQLQLKNISKGVLCQIRPVIDFCVSLQSDQNYTPVLSPADN